jgi:hypothetical protein
MGTQTKASSAFFFLGELHIPWWIFHLLELNRFPYCLFPSNKQASLSLQSSFSVSPGCFAWILCCLLQMCRKEIEWPHLTLRVNYISNNSTNSFPISNTILLLQAKKYLAGSHPTRNQLFRVQTKMGAGMVASDTHLDFHPRLNCITVSSPHPQLWAMGSRLSHINKLRMLWLRSSKCLF